jgi:hypothetical protein
MQMKHISVQESRRNATVVVQAVVEYLKNGLMRGPEYHSRRRFGFAMQSASRLPRKSGAIHQPIAAAPNSVEAANDGSIEQRNALTAVIPSCQATAEYCQLWLNRLSLARNTGLQDHTNTDRIRAAMDRLPIRAEWHR